MVFPQRIHDAALLVGDVVHAGDQGFLRLYHGLPVGALRFEQAVQVIGQTSGIALGAGHHGYQGFRSNEGGICIKGQHGATFRKKWRILALAHDALRDR